jgi:hypothetical protein
MGDRPIALGRPEGSVAKKVVLASSFSRSSTILLGDSTPGDDVE